MKEDLFWAIRGASFGVILAWKLKLVRVPEKVTVFTVYKKLEGNQNLLQKWGNIAHQLPDKLLVRVVIQNDGTGNDKYVEIFFQALYLGPVDELIPLLKEKISEFDLEKKDCFQEPVVTGLALKKNVESSWIGSVLYFYGRRTNESLEVLLEKNYFKATSDFVKTPVPEKEDSMDEEMELYVAKSPRTAYLNYRDLDFGTNQEDYSYSKAKIWGEKYFKGNFERLAKVKSKVDPNNFFRNEQSIPSYHTDN
ncbi:hypothetical protein K7X08_018195 [Anisodus acutangulus]|uniref:Berberine/berberine-like domain-containing protein n=1 Tax=Anisodus acutangulus TaxID=402998 RepID=A0A9Q1R9A4_9SOLA|nr:hypothetical protein K7X08_018195 [Anisodus acutangulus]